MPSSLNPKPKPVFKNMVMALAGDIGTPEAQARQYLSLRQGSLAAKFDETVTHVLATAEQFKEKGPMIKSALASKNVKIVHPDWFTSCMFQNKLLAITPWSHRTVGKAKLTGKVNESGGAKGKKIQSLEDYVDTERHHFWKDGTGFEYALKLDGKDEDWWTLELWQSNALPHLYHCAGHFYKKGSLTKPKPWRISELPGNFEREYKLFRAIFFRKTGVKWEQRIEAADDQGLVKSRIAGTNKPAYDYQLPMANMPRGEIDVLMPQRPQKPKQSQSDAGNAIRAMKPSASKTSSDKSLSSKAAPTTKTAAVDSLLNSLPDQEQESVSKALEQHKALAIPPRKRPSLAPDITLPSPPPSSPVVSAHRASSLGQKYGRPTLTKPSVPFSSMLTATPKQSRKTQQSALTTPHTPDQLAALGLTPALTPTAPKKFVSPMQQASMKRKLELVPTTPTGNVQKKLAVRASVDENKLMKAKMATEARPKASEPEGSNKSADNSGIIDLDPQNGNADAETHVGLAEDTVVTPKSDEKHDYPHQSGLGGTTLEEDQSEKHDFQGQHDDKFAVLEASIGDDERQIEDEIAALAEDSGDDSSSTSSTD